MRFCFMVQKPTPTVTSAAVESAVSQCFRIGRQTARTSMKGSRSALVGVVCVAFGVVTVLRGLGYRTGAREKRPGVVVQVRRGPITFKSRH